MRASSATWERLRTLSSTVPQVLSPYWSQPPGSTILCSLHRLNTDRPSRDSCLFA